MQSKANCLPKYTKLSVLNEIITAMLNNSNIIKIITNVYLPFIYIQSNKIGITLL